VTFQPTADQLLPELTQRQELAILARTLWSEGYDDHLAGHITIRQPDGTLLCNPWYITWEEVRPEQVIRIDLEGNVLEGDWPAPLGIPLHLALHKLRDDVEVAVHSHPRFGTAWANAGRIPPVHDQSSSLGGGRLTIVDEYEGGVDNMSLAESAVRAMGDADMALLTGHGVFVLASSVRAAHQRSVALEQRARIAWHVEALGGGKGLSPAVADRMLQSDGNGFIGFWEAAARQVLRADPSLLD
jgi:L-ribulose-5-phosphate 4-epimerase